MGTVPPSRTKSVVLKNLLHQIRRFSDSSGDRNSECGMQEQRDPVESCARRSTVLVFKTFSLIEPRIEPSKPLMPAQACGESISINY